MKKKLMEAVYYEECSTCHKDFKTGKDSEQDKCPICRMKIAQQKSLEADKLAEDKANTELFQLIGAKIIKIIPRGSGTWVNASEIGSILVETIAGKVVTFEAGGWDERYIEWGAA